MKVLPEKETHLEMKSVGKTGALPQHALEVAFQLKNQSGPHLILCSQREELSKIRSAVRFFEPEQNIFSLEDSLFWQDSLDFSLQAEGRLFLFLAQMAQARVGDVFILSPLLMLRKLPPLSLFKQKHFLLKKGQVFPANGSSVLSLLGYQSRSRVERAGEFSIRGGIVDIFCSLPDPLRIELMGEEIAQIKTFNVESQRSQREMDQVRIPPVQEWCLYDKEKLSHPPSSFINYFSKKPCVWHLNSLEKLNQKKQELNPVDPVFYSKRFFSHPDWPQKIKEQRQKGFLIFIFSPNDLGKKEFILKLNQVGMKVKKESSWWDMKTTQESSSLVLHFIESISFESLIWPEENLIFLQGSAGGSATLTYRQTSSLKKSQPAVIPPLVSNPRSGGTAGSATLAERGSSHTTGKPATHAVGSRSGGASSLAYRHTSSLKKSQPAVIPPLVKNPRSGFFATLEPGDLVVHKLHGIGLFKSLRVLNFGVGDNEFLILQYQDQELLYVPVYALQMVQKYTTPFSLQTKKKLLDKLGGKRWLNTKIRAQKKIQNLTLELMSLYQARAVLKRNRFSLPGEDFKKFEREFSFKETPDQQKAIEDILNDLTQKDRPADRLIAGDTGFGKTEIALRAVFKVVEDGFQVGLMAPTTLLSFQHFEKFKERFKPWPITLRLLNRFTSSKEKGETLKLVKAGQVDILIGTHTLLSRDIEFKKLGLLIIDEEHLFGVRSKEKLKNRYKAVDTISLSATPLPRSLSMGLSRLRDMSAVLTPPLNRKPVQTLVSPFNEGLIKTAIQKELNRGGQVIFIHNRVRDIKEMERKLKELLPSSARIRTAHGQTKDLREKIALDFFYQRFDILLCTTIVESGMDFPNANTLFINQAEQFGLSQLHQIRGRTGRSDKTAYCYLLIKPQVSKQAIERLKIIQENSFPGAGTAIAQYDLEMRGAGELMGREQSGFLKDIGYEMYFEFLQKNILNLQNKKPLSMEEEPDLKLPHPAFIPSHYIPHEKTRLFFYKKLSVVESTEEITQIKKELIDFAGPLPKEGENLISISRIRMLCKAHLVRELSYRKNLLTFYFTENAPTLKQPTQHSDYNPKKRALKFSLKTTTLDEIEDICIKYLS